MLLRTDHELDSVVERARAVVRIPFRNLDSLEEVEPEGVEYLRRLRGLIPSIAEINQQGDKWRGLSHAVQDGGLEFRRQLYQPLAMTVMWPLTEELIDHMDEVGLEEIQSLRKLIQVLILYQSSCP